MGSECATAEQLAFLDSWRAADGYGGIAYSLQDAGVIINEERQARGLAEIAFIC